MASQLCFTVHHVLTIYIYTCNYTEILPLTVIFPNEISSCVVKAGTYCSNAESSSAMHCLIICDISHYTLDNIDRVYHNIMPLYVINYDAWSNVHNCKESDFRDLIWDTCACRSVLLAGILGHFFSYNYSEFQLSIIANMPELVFLVTSSQPRL